MKFIVDCMLGKLAKWLKILGFDTLYFSKIEDSDFLQRAEKENRIILTRDTDLIQQSGKMDSLFIESEDWKVQVKQVLEEFNLWEKVKPNSRCIECNVPLKNLSRREARNLVTPFIYEQAESFALCPRCGRTFWQGTHFHDMENRIQEIFEKKKRGQILEKEDR
jgi:hypothetical protein